MLTPILTLAVVGSTAPWFGPVDVSFRAEFPGNPQDGEANRVDLVFRPERGRETIVPAWERNGVWSGTFLTRTPGRYTVTLRRNGRAVTLPPKTVDVRRRSDVAFVRRSGAGFRLDGGAAYWPIGHNLGWNSSTHTVERQLGEMGRNGLNWARIWACHWDGKNPFFGAPAGPAAAGLMNQTVLDRWDRITEAAEKAGVRFQLVLFHHGLFSTSTNPNWQEHPWNTANGGFLQNPADFFTDPTAKRLSRNWLRYAVARYGSSPSIMSWELFNEVEWVDAIRNGRSADVGRWHDEMADYIRSIDPYRLLVTTSSETHLPIYRKADFLQPHSYVQNLETRIAAEPQPKGRPVFFGEVGRATHEGPDIREQEKTIPREAAWAAAFAGHGGAAQYWFWDRVTAYDMYPEYRRQTEVLRRSGFMAQAPGRPERAKVEGPRGGDLVGSPGQGWGATRATEIDLDADPQGTAWGRISDYFQGAANRNLFPQPLRIRLTLSEPTRVVVRFGTKSRAGARIVLSSDEGAREEVFYPASDTDRGADPNTISIPLGAGRRTITLANTGADWVRLEEVRFPGAGELLRVNALSLNDRHLVRVRRSGDRPAMGRITVGGLKAGVRQVSAFDLDTARERKVRVEVDRNGAFDWRAERKDEIVVVPRPEPARR